MGALFAFLLGWALGARGGKEGYDEVVTAAKEVLASDEVAVLKVALRQHAGYTLRQLGEWLQGAEKPEFVTDSVARVRDLVSPTAADDDD